jgi:hypothetical protein
MTGYHLSRQWFDWTFENPDIHTPAHTALYMWVIEKWNRMGQKEKFGLPTAEAMEVLGISSINTYKKVFSQLVEWGFIEEIQASKNQYTSRIVALSKSDKASTGALDKALKGQLPQQNNSTMAGMDDIDKQETGEPIAKKTECLVEAGGKKAEMDSDNSIGMAGIDFQAVWEAYDKKVGDRHRCEKKWHKLSDKEKWLVWRHIPTYVQSTPEKKYRANLETYLNQKRWNNEIIYTHAKSGNTATSASAKFTLEKRRAIGGDPVRKNIFGKETQSG